MEKKLSQKKAKKAFDAFIKSEESQQTPEQKRENAWFPMHIKSIIEDKNGICYKNGLKTGESIVKTFGFDISDAWKFSEGLKLFYSGVVNAIEKLEAKPPKAE